jgi:C-terminal processing protease CtpA/Prc
VEGKIVLTHVRDAQGEPVAAGDEVLKILGEPVETLYAEAAALTSGATEQWIRFRAMYELTRCSGPVLDVLIARRSDPTHPRQISLRCEPMPSKEPRPGRSKEVAPGIWYVNLDGIKDTEWNDVRPKLESAKGLIFDMRGYPGMGPRFLQHLSKDSLKSAQWHVPIVLAPDRTSVEWNRSGEWDLPAAEPFLSAKRVFLINGSAISYAESVMGIVEHYKLGEIVGEPTAGTNGNVNPFPIPGGQRISWTGMKVLKHDGSRHHGVGIKPTVPVSRTIAGVAAGRDEYLEKAIEILKAP